MTGLKERGWMLEAEKKILWHCCTPECSYSGWYPMSLQMDVTGNGCKVCLDKIPFELHVAIKLLTMGPQVPSCPENKKRGWG